MAAVVGADQAKDGVVLPSPRTSSYGESARDQLIPRTTPDGIPLNLYFIGGYAMDGVGLVAANVAARNAGMAWHYSPDGGKWNILLAWATSRVTSYAHANKGQEWLQALSDWMSLAFLGNPSLTEDKVTGKRSLTLFGGSHNPFFGITTRAPFNTYIPYGASAFVTYTAKD